MQNRSFKSIAFLAITLLVLSGCDNKRLAPVSGIVTHDGVPLAKVEVVFSPEPIGEDNSVGPFSKGETDATGKFELKTRHGDPGAFVGKHTVSFAYSDISQDAMEELRDNLADAKEEGADGEVVAELNKKIQELTAKLQGRPVLEAHYPAVIEIPDGGTDSLNLELTEMTEK